MRGGGFFSASKRMRSGDMTEDYSNGDMASLCFKIVADWTGNAVGLRLIAKARSSNDGK